MKKYLAEGIGTFVLTFFGCGTAVLTGCSVVNPGAYLLTALAFGLAIVAMAYSIGNISGCHVNPAVSVAMFLLKKLNVKDLFGYVIAQFIGAIFAGSLLCGIFGAQSGLGVNGLYHGDIALSFVIEVVLTFVFVLCIIGVTSKKEFSSVAGLVIGLSLTFVHILGIGFTGTSVNPARSFGPALFAASGAMNDVWVFLFAPVIGAILAAFVYSLLRGDFQFVRVVNEDVAMIAEPVGPISEVNDDDKRGLLRGLMNNEYEAYCQQQANDGVGLANSVELSEVAKNNED